MAYGNWTQDFLKARMNSTFLATWMANHQMVTRTCMSSWNLQMAIIIPSEPMPQIVPEMTKGEKSLHNPYTLNVSHPRHYNSPATTPSPDHTPNASAGLIPRNSTHVHVAMGSTTLNTSSFTAHDTLAIASMLA